MTSEKPYQAPRRWLPRFGLRLLLLAMVLLSCASAWVGCQLDWIRQRHAVLKNRYDFSDIPDLKGLWYDDRVPPPWPLALFGEESVRARRVFLHHTVSDDELARAEWLFPETEVRSRLPPPESLLQRGTE